MKFCSTASKGFLFALGHAALAFQLSEQPVEGGLDRLGLLGTGHPLRALLELPEQVGKFGEGLVGQAVGLLRGGFVRGFFRSFNNLFCRGFLRSRFGDGRRGLLNCFDGGFYRLFGGGSADFCYI